VPEYWENPARPGVAATPPPMDLETWAQRRPLHLATEIERAGQELLAAREASRVLAAKSDQMKADLDAKLQAAAEYEGQVHTYWISLREQVLAEFPEGIPDPTKVSDEVVALADETEVQVQAERKRWWRK
jgi:hypothetical protein